jgi:WD40 repeat protein
LNTPAKRLKPAHVLTGHTEQVRSVAVSNDGQRIISAANDGTIRVWDRTTRQEQGVFYWQGGPVDPIAVAPAGRFAVSGGEDGVLRIWDLRIGRGISAELVRSTARINAVAVTPDGRVAVSGGTDHTVTVWDVSAGKVQTVLRGHTNQVNAVAVTADGRLAVSGDQDGLVRIWDAQTGQAQAVFPRHTGPVYTVDVTPDGTCAVSGGVNLRILETGPDGQQFVSGGNSPTVCVWNLTSGRGQAFGTPHCHIIDAVAVTADGRRVVATGAEQRMLWAWDFQTAQVLAWSKDDFAGYSLALTPDSHWVIEGCADGAINIWDLAALMPDTQLSLLE